MTAPDNARPLSAGSLCECGGSLLPHYGWESAATGDRKFCSPQCVRWAQRLAAERERADAARLAGVRAGIEAAAAKLFASIPEKTHPDLSPNDEHGWSLGVRYMAAFGAAAIRALSAERIADALVKAEGE